MVSHTECGIYPKSAKLAVRMVLAGISIGRLLITSVTRRCGPKRLNMG